VVTPGVFGVRDFAFQMLGTSVENLAGISEHQLTLLEQED